MVDIGREKANALAVNITLMEHYFLWGTLELCWSPRPNYYHMDLRDRWTSTLPQTTAKLTSTALDQVALYLYRNLGRHKVLNSIIHVTSNRRPYRSLPSLVTAGPASKATFQRRWLRVSSRRGPFLYTPAS